MRYSLLFALLFLGSGLMAIAQQDDPDPSPTATAASTQPAESTAAATDDPQRCPALVNNAMTLTEINCTDTRTNEACYGFIFIDSELRSEQVRFVEPGDILNISTIESLQLSPMDTESGQWGLMVMDVEANVPGNSTPITDDVQIVLFGDTRLQDASQFVQVTALETLNLRQQPSTDAPILGQVLRTESIIANARLDNGDWLRVRVSENGDSYVAWLAAEFVEVASDVQNLPALTLAEANNPPDDLAVQFGPMQAFYFSSEQDDAPCAEAPNSGMLIQTPEGVASVTLWLDEVVIEFSGTGVISAQANDDLTVNVLDGSAQVNANGDERTAIAGQAIDVPLDENLSPLDVPGAPRAIDQDDVQAVPTNLLDDPLGGDGVGAPASVAESAGNSSVPIGGEWAVYLNQEPPFICDDGQEVTYLSTNQSALIIAQSDAIVFSGLQYNLVNTGVYRATYSDASSNLIQDTLQVVATDRMFLERTIDFLTPICTLNLSYTLQLNTPQP